MKLTTLKGKFSKGKADDMKLNTQKRGAFLSVKEMMHEADHSKLSFVNYKQTRHEAEQFKG